MVHDPNAETSEIPVLRVHEQMRRLAERAHRDETHERLYDPLTATRPIPIIPQHGHGSHRAPRRHRMPMDAAVLLLAVAMLAGTGAAIQLTTSAGDVPVKALSTPRSPVVPGPVLGPEIPVSPPPTPEATPWSAPVTWTAQTTFSRPRKAKPTHRAVPVAAEPSTAPPSPSLLPAPIPTLDLSPSPVPSVKPSPTLSPSPSPSLMPSPSISVSASPTVPSPTPVISISLGLPFGL